MSELPSHHPDKKRKTKGAQRAPVTAASDYPTEFWEKTYPQLKRLAQDPDEVDDLPRQFASREGVASLVGVDTFRSLAETLRPAGYVAKAVPDGDFHRQTIFEKGEGGENDYLQIRIGDEDTYDSAPTTEFAYEQSSDGGESLRASHRRDGIHRELEVQLFAPGEEPDGSGFLLEIMEKEGLFGIPAQIMVTGKESAEGKIDLVAVQVNIPPKSAQEEFFIADPLKAEE